MSCWKCLCVCWYWPYQWTCIIHQAMESSFSRALPRALGFWHFLEMQWYLSHESAEVKAVRGRFDFEFDFKLFTHPCSLSLCTALFITVKRQRVLGQIMNQILIGRKNMKLMQELYSKVLFGNYFLMWFDRKSI